jgi:uncharacterized protein with HEPN domain
MIDAAETALRFVRDRTRSDLNDDQMLLFALVRAIEIIGEAASRITPATRTAIVDVPWADAIAMRNRLIHGYFDVNPDVVWATATEELPQLLPKPRDLLQREDRK